jgi:hypothetical protein
VFMPVTGMRRRPEVIFLPRRTPVDTLRSG